MSKITISGFYDEVSGDLNEQIALMHELGETYMCPRTINNKNIADYTFEEFERDVYPVLQKEGIKFSSIGSPIGKVGIDDEEGFEKQKKPGAESGKEPRVLRKSEYTAFGKIILKERRLTPEPSDISGAWINLVKTEGIRALPWNGTCENFLLRAEFYLKHKTADANASSANAGGDAKTAETLLTESAEEWLPAFIPQKGSPDAGTVLDAIRWKLDGTEVDRNAPQKIKLDNGKERRISYEIISREEGGVPVLEIIIQQMFGCFETPRIMGVPVLLKLLSPARRPLQITQDLSGFWKNTWPEICREMKGRYPKHNWDYTKFLDD